MHEVSEPLDPTRPDPHDPLAPRPDDPRIGRWWWGPRYARDPARSLFLRWPGLVLLMMLLVGVTALVVVILSGPA